MSNYHCGCMVQGSASKMQGAGLEVEGREGEVVVQGGAGVERQQPNAVRRRWAGEQLREQPRAGLSGPDSAARAAAVHQLISASSRPHSMFFRGGVRWVWVRVEGLEPRL